MWPGRHGGRRTAPGPFWRIENRQSRIDRRGFHHEVHGEHREECRMYGERRVHVLRCTLTRVRGRWVGSVNGPGGGHGGGRCSFFVVRCSVGGKRGVRGWTVMRLVSAGVVRSAVFRSVELRSRNRKTLPCSLPDSSLSGFVPATDDSRPKTDNFPAGGWGKRSNRAQMAVE